MGMSGGKGMPCRVAGGGAATSSGTRVVLDFLLPRVTPYREWRLFRSQGSAAGRGARSRPLCPWLLVGFLNVFV